MIEIIGEKLIEICGVQIKVYLIKRSRILCGQTISSYITRTIIFDLEGMKQNRYLSKEEHKEFLKLRTRNLPGLRKQILEELDDLEKEKQNENENNNENENEEGSVSPGKWQKWAH